MTKEIIFVTSNKGKVASAQKYLEDANITLSHYASDIDEPNVNDIDFIATHKVKEAFMKINKPCISLDAGFYIPHFPNNPNFPGAFPKRELINKMGIDGLLIEMKNVENRECYFKQCLAYFDGSELKLFHGYSYGNLATERRGNDLNKKWSELWEVFIPQNCTKTLAEMTDEERYNRKDNRTSEFVEFSQWFKSQEDVMQKN